ncbi:MAG TPA: hypothetical protein VJW51_00840, partial [Candidatus Acidoferrales bacterium]|nr:hypothetical protein [Candidatus Acidoferrales bacterium]
MKRERRKKANAAPLEGDARGAAALSSPGRRAFLGKIGAAATMGAAALASPGVISAAQSEARGNSRGAAAPEGVTNGRVMEAFELRTELATQDALAGPARNLNNGDDALYRDKAGTYTKCLAHDAYGRVDPGSYASFKHALSTGRFSDFENIIMGGTRTLNGPQGGLAFDLEAMDNAQFGQPQVPPAPTVASNQTATELVEHYWASLLRDVAFTDYGTSALAAAAAAELG